MPRPITTRTAIAAAILALPCFARATPVDHYFVGPTNSLFSDPANWSTSPNGPGGSPPASYDNAIVNHPGLASLTLDASPAGVPLSTLSLSGSPSSPLSLTHTGSLTASTTLIGPYTSYSATGSAFAQFYPIVDGTNAILSLNAPSGNFQFHQGASVGPSAGGSFSLSNGYVFLEHPLTFGGSAGTASGLIAGGTLSGSVRLDSAARATVTQTGGTVTSSALLGRNASYTLSGGTIASVSLGSKDPYSPLSVPSDSGATFSQTGGSVTRIVTVNAYAPDTPALYALSGGTISSPSTNPTLTVASAYAATFLQTGGTVGGGTNAAPPATDSSTGAYVGDPAAVYLGRTATPGTPSAGTYSLSSTGQLFTNKLYVGHGDHGTFTQSGGSLTLRGKNPALSLGTQPSATGSYSLSAGTLSFAPFGPGSFPPALLAVGDAGTGAFVQSGGSVSLPTSAELRLGNAAGSTGTYSLSNDASLSLDTNAYAYVGYSGTGSFAQSGGSLSAAAVVNLGYNAGATGTYSLSAGTLSAGLLYAGYSGSGTLSVSGGVASVSTLSLADLPGSAASLSLTGGSLSTTYLTVATNGAAAVTHSAGSLHVTQTLTLASSYSSSASYALSGTASLHAAQLLVGRDPSSDASFSQSGGTVSLHSLNIPPAGPGVTHAYSLSAGTLTIDSSGTPASLIRSYLHDRRLASPPTDPTHRLAYTDTGSSLTISLALAGDANLDGQITPDDYTLLDRAYARSLSNAHWTDGDFNYDGLVDQNDYLLIDSTLGQAHGFSPGFLSQRESQFGATYVSTLLATVPEPTSLSLLALTILFRLRRTSSKFLS